LAVSRRFLDNARAVHALPVISFRAESTLYRAESFPRAYQQNCISAFLRYDQHMKKAQIRTYGGADAIEIVDAPTPTPGPTELLLKVHAASVNPIDWKIARGAVRPILPYRLPIGLGYDVSGEVMACGADVSNFAIGDLVFARVGRPNIGTFAEAVTVDASHVARKPESLSHSEAAAIPLVGLTSWQVLTELCDLKPGQRVLIHAGAGGIGTIAIQIAKSLGAHVITTASAGNHELVRALGADQVIDYRNSDFSTQLSELDVVFDTIGGQTLKDSFRVVRRGGRIVSIASIPDPETIRDMEVALPIRAALWLANWPFRRLASRYGVNYRYWFMRPDGKQLDILADLVRQGRLKPIIDRTYPLDNLAEAFRYMEAGHAHGKVIITPN